MGKAVNLWVCNAQYWAFLENQLHIMGVRLCCLIPKLLAQQLSVVSYSLDWDFPCSPQWAWTQHGCVQNPGWHTYTMSQPTGPFCPWHVSLLSPSKKNHRRNPSCFCRLNRCLEKTFREHFWGALWGRVQNKKSVQRKDKGQRKPYRGNKPRAGEEHIWWAEPLTALVPDYLVKDVGIEISLGRWRQCHPVEEWSRILTVKYNKDNVKGEAYHPL